MEGRDDRGADRRSLGGAFADVAEIRSIQAYTHGPDVGLGHDRFDYAIVADFDDLEGWRVYDTHPVHDKVRAEIIRPHIAESASAPFAL